MLFTRTFLYTVYYFPFELFEKNFLCSILIYNWLVNFAKAFFTPTGHLNKVVYFFFTTLKNYLFSIIFKSQAKSLKYANILRYLKSIDIVYCCCSILVEFLYSDNLYQRFKVIIKASLLYNFLNLYLLLHRFRNYFSISFTLGLYR